MRYIEGYFPIPRKSVEKLKNSPNALSIYCLLRSWAPFKQTSVIISGKEIPISETQVLTGVGELSRWLGISPVSINKSIKLLRRLDIITSIENHHSCRLFTLDSTYDENSDTAISRIKKEELKTKNKKLKSTPKISDDENTLASEWLSWSLTVTPSIKASAHDFAVSISEFCRIEKISANDLRQIFEFIRKNEFWAKNAVSPAGLRTRSKNGLLKYQNILNDMKGKESQWSEVKRL